MTYFVADLDVGRLLAAPSECPDCSAGGLEAVSDGELSNFWCPSCGSCWHIELGNARRVSPSSCPDCTRRERCLGAQVPAG